MPTFRFRGSGGGGFSGEQQKTYESCLQAGALRVPVRPVLPARTRKDSSENVTCSKQPIRRHEWNSYSRNDNLYRLTDEEQIRWKNSRIQGRKQLELIAEENKIRAKSMKAKSTKIISASLGNADNKQDETRKGPSVTSSTQDIVDDINKRLECLTLFIDVNKREMGNSIGPGMRSPYSSLSSSTESGLQHTSTCNIPSIDQLHKSETKRHRCERFAFDDNQWRDSEDNAGEFDLSSRSENFDALNIDIGNKVEACENIVDESERNPTAIVMDTDKFGGGKQAQLECNGRTRSHELEKNQDFKYDEQSMPDKDKFHLDMANENFDLSSEKECPPSSMELIENVLLNEKGMQTVHTPTLTFAQAPYTSKKNTSTEVKVQSPSTQCQPLTSHNPRVELVQESLEISEIVKHSVPAILSISVGKEDEWRVPSSTRL